MTDPPAPAEQRARDLTDGDAAAIPVAPQPEPLALARALKQLCYDTWNSEPARAVRAAQVLRGLAGTELPPDGAAEIRALADWTAGVACIIQGRLAEAVPLFDSAAAGLSGAGLADQAAQTQVPKIMALSMTGQLDAAAACGATTQRELRALGNLHAAARVSLNLGNLHMVRDAYAEAALQFREAAVLFARQGDVRHSVLADIGWAVTLSWTGDFDEALLVYARARMRAANHGLAMQLALVDESVALLELARGRFRDALAGLESARRRYELLGVPQLLAVVEKQLADVYLELRLLPEALAMFETAVARFDALDLRVEKARALTQLGRTQALLGQGGADDALAAAEALYAGLDNAVGQAAVALARAELSLAAGDGAAALHRAEQAMHAYATAHQADGRARAEVLRADALLALGRGAEASVAFRAAAAAAPGQQQLQVRCRVGTGLAALAAGDRTTAVADLESAIELFEVQRRALPGDELRTAFLADHLRPYQARLRIALEEGRPEGVLVQLDRVRARTLDERLSEGAAGETDHDLRTLRERLDWLYRRARREGEGAAVAAGLHQEVLHTERELMERARRLRFAALPRGDTGGGTVPVEPAQLQAALGAGDAVVEYGVFDGELFACVVRRDGIRVQRHLADWAAVREGVGAARFQIETLRHGSAALLAHLPVLTARAEARLQRLHALLWAPLEPLLQGCTRVLIVPHGVLANVPFAALGDAAGPLGARFELALVASARAALRGLQRAPAPARRALALGESTRLPHAAQEARFVASLFPQGQAFVGEAASLQALRAHAAGADVLHLACHAQFRTDNPRFSALQLADAALTVEDAEQLPLQAAIVVLSACETGVSDAAAGDEMIGLVRAFMVAGASRVVASLWPVDDAITRGFMAHFYRALTTGAGPAAALRLAQDTTRRENPHPYFWGAFALQGGW